MAIITRTTDEIVNIILAELIGNNSDITDYNVGSVIRIITEAIATQMGYDGDTDNLYQQVYDVYLNSRVETATEDSLDQIGSLVGVERTSGATATGYVTFKRNTDLTSGITIAQGTIVGTTPNDDDGQRQYRTISGATFPSKVTAETHNYVDGIYNYPLNYRFFNNIDAVSGTYSGAAYVFTADTDYTVTSYDDYYLNTDEDITTVDDCDTTSGWSGYNCTVSAGSGYYEGSGSISIKKTSTTDVECYIDNIISSIDVSNLDPHIYINIPDTATFNKIFKIDLYLSSDSIANSVQYTLSRTELSVGFNQYYPQTSVINGNPSLDDITLTRLKVTTYNTTDVFDDVGFDYFVFGTVESHVGNVLTFDKDAVTPDTDTDFYITYNPRSVDVDVEAVEIGTTYNVSIGKVIYKVTNLPNITSIYNYVSMNGGEEIESDDDYRERIINESSSAGRATVNSIKTRLLSIDGIRSVVIEDLPLTSTTNEPHIFHQYVTDYKLWNEVVYLDDDDAPTNIEIRDAYGSGSDYTYGTDYTVDDSVITWISGATNPTAGNTFFVDYQYNHLGFANAYIFGYTSPLSDEITDEIDEAINDEVSGYKGAGVVVNWSEATQQFINVEATVELKTGFTLTQTLKESITTAINNYITSLEVGDDVVYNEIVKAIMQVTGIYNCDVTTPSADTTIATNKIAVIGEVTISE